MQNEQNKFYMSDGYSDFPSYVERSSPKPKLLLIFVIVLLLIIAALGGLYFLGASSGKNLLLQAVAPAPTPTPIAILTPTPTVVVTQPPLERGDLTVAIKNGSGTAGAARGVSTYLEEVGYKLGPVGNADKFTYEGITIHVKQAQSAYLAQLESDIKKNDPDASISASVDDTITTEAEVIVGK